MTYRKLTGDQCRCPSCGEYFNSTKAFDKHRVGEIGKKVCLSPNDMVVKKGMSLSSRALWITEPFKERR